MISNAKYVHTNILSSNWEKLAEFYEKVFGCKRVLPERDLSGKWIEDATSIPGVHIKGIHLRLPGYGNAGPTLEIFGYNNFSILETKTINQTGFTHIAFLVDNVEEALKEVIENGGSTIGKITETEIPGAGKITFVYARDPEGNIVEIQNWVK